VRFPPGPQSASGDENYPGFVLFDPLEDGLVHLCYGHQFDFRLDAMFLDEFPATWSQDK